MQTQHEPFDADATLAAVRADREARRHRRTWGKSRLTPHRAELVKLRQAGASLADLAHWLRTEKRLKLNRSTIGRFLEKLPELAEPADTAEANG